MGHLASLCWWQAVAQVSKALHNCLLYLLPMVSPGKRGSSVCFLRLEIISGIFLNDGDILKDSLFLFDGLFLGEVLFIHEGLFLQGIPRGGFLDACRDSQSSFWGLQEDIFLSNLYLMILMVLTMLELRVPGKICVEVGGKHASLALIIEAT